MVENRNLKIELHDPRSAKEKGGQHTGSFPKAVKVTHIPTGIFAVCGSERTQHKNKKVAIDMIEYGLVSIGLNTTSRRT